MRRLRLALLALLAPFVMGQAQPRLVPGLSQEQVEIRYSFSGAELLLFGAILYPGGQTPARPPDIAVVLKGPLERIVLREKERVAGIWMNVERVRFRSAPAFYAVASSQGATGSDAIATLFQSSTTNVVLLILAYLVVLGAFTLLAELILAYGWWRLLARSASISNPDSLKTVRATIEDRSLIGQGLADALNVGAY